MSIVEGYRFLFLLTIGIGIAMALVVLPVHEQQPSRQDTPATRSRPGRLSPRTRSVIARFAVTNTVNGFAIGFLGPFLVYWFNRRYGADAAQLGVLFFLINLATAPFYLFAARLARRLGEVNIVVVTRTMAAALLFVMAFAPTFLIAGALYLGRMVTATVAMPVRQSYLMGVVEPSERSTAAGLSGLPTQITGAVSPTIAGYLIQSVSLDLPVALAALLQGLNATLYYLFFRDIHPPEELEDEARDASKPASPVGAIETLRTSPERGLHRLRAIHLPRK